VARHDLRVLRRRVAGRSTIHVIGSDVTVDGRNRWLVKQPNAAWTQDDLAAPVAAEQELRALTELDRHLREQGDGYRVPAPVALLPEVGALAMEYVEGRSLRQLLTFRGTRHPAPLVDGVARAGTFLRHLHDVAPAEAVRVDLRDEARTVVLLADELLRPLGLDLPDRVRRVLHTVPAVQVTAQEVALHGDFGPGNIVLATDGSVVGLDVTLTDRGVREEDLARFLVMVSTSLVLAPDLVRPGGGLSPVLERSLLEGYAGTGEPWPLLELKVLQQLVRRWPRARQLAQQSVRGPLQPLRTSVLGRQVQRFMTRSARHLSGLA
jgi:aminoglycoside phosphotransferase (APT) family kinase protein